MMSHMDHELISLVQLERFTEDCDRGLIGIIIDPLVE